MRKFLYIIIIMALVCSAFVGCDAENVNNPTEGVLTPKGNALVGNIPVSFPLTNSSQKLKIVTTAAGDRPQDDVFVWQKYEQKTGVDVIWTELTKSNRSEFVHTALTNNQQYDLIMRCKISSTKLLRYGNSGLVLDLAKDGLLKNNAPNCWAYLQSHPDALASVMNPDGTIYALPQVNSGAELRVGTKLFVNKLWLERVNMELPTTTEELRTLLTAFRDLDANGNGDTTDEIPFCSADWANTLYSLYGAFGLANRGFHNTSVDCDPVTGKTRYIAGSEGYRDFLDYMHGLYTDELVDQYMFTITSDQWLANITADRVGVFPMTNLALLPADKADNWVGIEEALEGPNGDKIWSGVRANFHSTGAAVIPATCSNPQLVLRWLDYFWTDEGTLFYHLGTEGETFVTKADGTYDYAPSIYQRMVDENRSFDDILSEYTPYPGGSNPTVEIAPYFMGGEMQESVAKTARALIEYGPTEYWPAFTFTQAESDAMDVVKGDLSKYCDNMRIGFITGEVSLDEWDTYTAKLDEMGQDEMTAAYQAAVDRYHAIITALN